MKKYTLHLLLSLLFFIPFSLHAQDDLLEQLQSEQAKPVEKVLATFKGNRLVNIQSNETVKKNNLDFRINHLFGNIGNESGGGIHTLYGLDQSNDIKIGLHYGITDRLTIGISRSKRSENLELLMKYKLVEQSTNGRPPIGITIFSNATLSTVPDELVSAFSDRYTYCTQLIIARKFSSRFSFEIAPSWLHRNAVFTGDKSDLLSLGGGLRWKFTRSTSVVTDYCFVQQRDGLFIKPVNPFGIGVEIETGGHVFSIMFTNASGVIENDFIPNTTDDWAKGGIKFSFIISRMFSFGKVIK